MKLTKKDKFSVGDRVVIHEVLMPSEKCYEGVVGIITSCAYVAREAFYEVDTALPGFTHWLAREMVLVEDVDISDISSIEL